MQHNSSSADPEEIKSAVFWQTVKVQTALESCTEFSGSHSETAEMSRIYFFVVTKEEKMRHCFKKHCGGTIVQ